jgi:hypothetical protein
MKDLLASLNPRNSTLLEKALYRNVSGCMFQWWLTDSRQVGGVDISLSLFAFQRTLVFFLSLSAEYSASKPILNTNKVPACYIT